MTNGSGRNAMGRRHASSRAMERRHFDRDCNVYVMPPTAALRCECFERHVCARVYVPPSAEEAEHLVNVAVEQAVLAKKRAMGAR